MADGSKISGRCSQSPNTDSDTETEDRPPTLNLDLGDDMSRVSDSNRLGYYSGGPSAAACSSDLPRREDNPFSFKHFLRSDSAGYQHKGARPKVYCEGRPVSSVSDVELPHMQESKQQTRIVPEYSSALPDFVQDHLVVEQCYLGHSAAPSNFNLDINLPDFTPSRSSVNINRINLDSSHDGSERCDNDLSIPLDLPIRHPQPDFPLDLPAGPSPTNGVRNSSSNEVVGVSKSLPDFLADGAVRQQNSNGPMLESPERETERLRQELDHARAQLSDQSRRVESLTRELEISRNKERDYTQNLAKALEQVEDNLHKSNIRTSSAENTVIKMKQEIKLLTSQIQHLKEENRSLRGEEGAAGGHQDYFGSNDVHSHRLAQELKAAASSAEHSLRQLLTGVDNLRIMAASLESMHRIEERRDPFLNMDDDSGPAL